MKGKHGLIFAFFLLCVVIGASAQRIDSLLQAYDSKVPQEKVYVHFDNTLYAAGQTVWYKAYLLSGLEPSTVSKNFYIDWFDDGGKLIKRIIAPVLSSTASGNFVIPENYAGEHLQVQAYTKWMLNFDSSFLFRHTLNVLQPAKTSAIGNAVKPVTNLHFFPEGGDMIDELQSTVAFKATLPGGLPTTVSGVINDSKGEMITTFQSTHNGMGRFSFVPSKNEKYTAEWKDAHGAVHKTELPTAKPNGLTFSLARANGKWLFAIERSAEGERLKKVTIFATIYQQVVFQAKLDLSVQTRASVPLPSGKFPSGVLRLTVMDNENQPLAERVIFINNHEYAAGVKVNMDTINLEKRGKNVFDIEWPDTTSASLSLAITDREYDSSVNIISGLLLSPEIKGYVHDPAYYFSSPADSIARQLDLVMMTNGWRRFAWENVFAGTAPVLPFTRDSGYLSIAGKIGKISASKAKKAELVNMILVAKDSSKQIISTPLQPDGSFRQDDLILFDTVKVFYQLNKSNIPAGSPVAIKNTFLKSDAYRQIPAIENYLPDTTGKMQLLAAVAEQKRLDSLSRQTTLKEVVVTTRAKTATEEMNEKFANGLFKKTIGIQFNLADDATAANSRSIFTYLLSRVPGLTILNASTSNPTATRRGNTVLFFVNEMNVDAETLATISPSNIAYVKVIDPPFFGSAVAAPGGAIAVYLKKGDEMISEGKGMDYTLFEGYTAVKQFYVPEPGEISGMFPRGDLRRTLYWNPNILLYPGNKKVRVSFYNNDISHTLQLVLEGITDDGRIVHYRTGVSQKGL